MTETFSELEPSELEAIRSMCYHISGAFENLVGDFTATLDIRPNSLPGHVSVTFGEGLRISVFVEDVLVYVQESKVSS